jgi:hypothetical protein
VDVAEAVEQVDEILGGEVARGSRGKRAASGATGRGVEAANPGRESRDDVCERGPARVVEVERDDVE